MNGKRLYLRLVYSSHDAQPCVREGRRKSAAPLNFTLGAMRNLSIFSVLPVAVFAAGSVAGVGVLVSRLAGGFERLLLARLFSRAAGFGVSRSFLVCSLLHRAQSVLGAVVFYRLGLLRSVAMFASNPALKRDCAKARSPLALR